MIKEQNNNKTEEVLRTNAWFVVFEKKKHFLQVDRKMLFEVVTVNHTVMVLTETASSDKVFFARENQWHGFLESNRQLAL